MSTAEPQRAYPSVFDFQVQFTLDYPPPPGEESAQPGSPRCMADNYSHNTTPDEIDAFADFLDGGGIVTLQGDVSALLMLMPKRTTTQDGDTVTVFDGIVFAEASGELISGLAGSPQIVLYSFLELEEAVRQILRQIFHTPRTDNVPRISALGCFHFGALYRNGNEWMSTVPDLTPSGGGSKM